MKDHASREQPPGRHTPGPVPDRVPGRGGCGAPLPTAVRTAMERSFRADFTSVRVHEDPQVAAIGAHAYTRGADIYFAPGRYKPHDTAGLQLLGHELTHVVQQAQGRVHRTRQLKGLPINDDAALEREADDLGARAALGEVVGGARTVAIAAPAAPAQGFFHSNDFHMAKASGDEASGDEASGDEASGDEALSDDSDSPAPFTTQSLRAASDNDGTAAFRRKIAHYDPAQANLLVADDCTMAIHDTAAEPKEFYATPAVVARSNRELANVESSFHLREEPAHTLHVGPRELLMVKPAQARPATEDRVSEDDNGFVSLLRHICIAMASEVVGNNGEWQYDLVLSDGDTGATYTRPIYPDGNHDDTVDRLGAYLATCPAKLGREAVERGLEAAPSADHAKTYGQLSGRGKLDRAAAIGVNRGALPEVGEAYAIFSQFSQSRPSADWSSGRRRPVRRSGGWGYHFAGVVAKSLQGDDRITLENYNRSFEIQDAVASHVLNAFADQVKKLRKQHRKATPAELAKKLIRENPEAAKMYREGHSKSDDPTRLWFFRMYGSRAGQTFHDLQSHETVNPLTVRVRRPLETHRAAKIRQVCDVLDKWCARLKETNIANHGAQQALTGLANQLRKERKRYCRQLRKAADPEALIRGMHEINERFATLVAAALDAARVAITGAPALKQPDLAAVKARIKCHAKAQRKPKKRGSVEKLGKCNRKALRRLGLIASLSGDMFEQSTLRRDDDVSATADTQEHGDSHIDDDLPPGSTARLLALYGLRIQPIAAHGDCMYDALCDQLTRVENLTITKGELRKKAKALIAANHARIKPFLVGLSVRKLTKQVERASSWNNQGGDIAAQIIATVLQRDIFMIGPDRVDILHPISTLVLPKGAAVQSNGEPLWVVYNGIDHYDSTVPQDQD